VSFRFRASDESNMMSAAVSGCAEGWMLILPSPPNGPSEAYPDGVPVLVEM
jgi:hypothetical protein